MNYTSCINIHKQGCDHFINRLDCPVGCVGYVWNGVGAKEIEQVLVDGPVMKDYPVDIPMKKKGY